MSQQPVDFDVNPPVVASAYDEMARLALPGYEAMHTMVLACLRSCLPDMANVLVVGAGTGTELVRLGQSHPQWQLVGVDPAAHMLEIAQHKLEQYQLSNRIQLVQGYICDLTTDTLYDAATSILVMHFIPDETNKLMFLKDIAQRLKPNAPLVLVDVFGEKGSPQLERVMAMLQAYWHVMGLSIDQQHRVLETFHHGVYPLPEANILDLLKQAGFCHALRFYTGLWVGGWMAFKILPQPLDAPY